MPLAGCLVNSVVVVWRTHTEVGRYLGSARNGVWATSGVTLNLCVVRRYCLGEGNFAIHTNIIVKGDLEVVRNEAVVSRGRRPCYPHEYCFKM